MIIFFIGFHLLSLRGGFTPSLLIDKILKNIYNITVKRKNTEKLP